MRREGSVLALIWLGLSAPAAAQSSLPEPLPPAEAAVAEPPAVLPAVPPANEAALPEARAVGSAASIPPPPDTLDPRAPAKTEVTLDRSTHVGAGLTFSGPLGAGASFRVLHGLGADVRDDGTRVKAVCAAPLPHCAQGFLLQVDAGSGGGKLSLGLGARARIDDDDFHGTAGVALRLALAHTWGNPIGTEPGLTYLGPELDLSVIRINLTLGVLFRVAGDGGSSALFSWGLGFGL